MADDHTKSAEALAAAAWPFLTKHLRAQCPFMETSLATRAVDKAVSELTKEVNAARDQISRSKARIGVFSLPAELRNYIYELYMIPADDEKRLRFEFDERQTTTWEIADCWRCGTSARCHEDRPNRIGFPSLLHMSQVVRNEALPIFLRHVTVVVGLDDFTPLDPTRAAPLAKAWLKAIGPERTKLIKEFLLTATWHPSRQTNDEVLSQLGLDQLGLRKDGVDDVELV